MGIAAPPPNKVQQADFCSHASLHHHAPRINFCATLPIEQSNLKLAINGFKLMGYP
jgi:hypothetical protein